jgi:hypothetical protein
MSKYDKLYIYYSEVAMKRYLLVLADEDHKILKVLAAQNDTSIKLLLLEAVQKFIDERKKKD